MVSDSLPSGTNRASIHAGMAFLRAKAAGRIDDSHVVQDLAAAQALSASDA